MKPKTAVWWAEFVYDDRPTPFETSFLAALDPRGLDLACWYHQDGDGAPWMLVSLDLCEDDRVSRTLRIDVDESGIRGGESPACLNWDHGVRAEAAEIGLTPPGGLSMSGSDVAALGTAASAWFWERSKSLEAGLTPR